MSVLMQWMEEKLEGIGEEEIQMPSNLGPVEDGEEEIGLLTDPFLRRVHVLRGHLRDQLNGLEIDDHNSEEEVVDHNPITCESCIRSRKADRLFDRMKVLDAIFWAGIQHELPEEAIIHLDGMGDDMAIGIREGWKIVAMRSSGPPPMARVSIFCLPVSISN